MSIWQAAVFEDSGNEAALDEPDENDAAATG